LVTTLCRDCVALAIAAAHNGRCGKCGSPRQVYRATLDRLSIAHVDCDAFDATVEERDRPDLADRPVIIAGGSRGVVLAC
jgi:DNA polymerase-4